MQKVAIQNITDYIQNDIEIINDVIKNDLSSEIVLINQISSHIINAGGKRLRPIITILCGRIAGFNKGNLLHKMAAMIEYIHTSTLLHDDVVDESGLRRGYKTSNALFGNAASILVGDFIYSRAFQMMVESNSLQVLKIMADSTNKISEGEVLQLLNIGNENLTEEEYFAVIKSKTATLFEAAARVAAIVSNASSSVEKHLANYAINLGIAFQIVDDILDYFGNSETLGKNIGDDLLEGKITLPLIYLIKNGNLTQKNLIINAIKTPNNDSINSLNILLKTTDALKYCQNLAHSHINLAIAELDYFKDSKYKEAMINLANLAINRTK